MSKRTFLAAVSLLAFEGLCVQMNADGEVSPATNGATGEQDLAGIVGEYGGEEAGKGVTVVGPGCETSAFVGAVLTPGTHRLLTTDEDSRLIPATAGTTAIAEWIGQATGPAAIGDRVQVRVCRVLIPAA